MNPAAVDDGDADPSIINLSLRLFAILDIGISVVSRGATSTLAPNAAAMRSVADLEEVLLTMWRAGDLSPEHRRAIWRGLVAELAELDVHTDPETLQALPFELVLTREVRDLVGQ